MNTVQRWGAGLLRLNADEYSPSRDTVTPLEALEERERRKGPSTTAMLAMNWIAAQATGEIVADGLPAEHPILQLLNRPTTARNVTGRSFWRAAVRLLLEHGNVFIRRVQTGEDELPTALRLVPGSEFEDEEGNPRPVPEDVLHIRIGVDLAKPERGVSPLTLVRDVLERDKSLQRGVARLENLAARKLGIFVPSGEVPFTPREVQEIERNFAEEGLPLAVSDTPGELHLLAPRSPDYEVSTEEIHAKICAAFNIHPAAINLAPGGSLTYSNVQEFRRESFQEGVIPIQEEVAAALERLLPPTLANVRLMFDNSQKAYAAPPETEQDDRDGE